MTELDVSDTILAKSDQLNSDDLCAGSIVVTVLGVSKGSTAEQPIMISISGGYQPFRPCKTMRRVLVWAWGKNGTEWVGRSMRLFRDPDVKWAGEKVGGIRIEAMSHIKSALTITLSETRGKKKPITIAVLSSVVAEWSEKIQKADSIEALKSIGVSLKSVTLSNPDRVTLQNAYKARNTELTQIDSNDTTPRHSAYNAILHQIMAITTSDDRKAAQAAIDSARESGEITAEESAELITEIAKGES